MGQMFDNYTEDKIRRNYPPDNEKTYLEINSEYKDSIIIGANNEHTFNIPYALNTLHYPHFNKIWITYKQGTEVVKEYEFCNALFEVISSEESSSGEYVWTRWNYTNVAYIDEYIVANESQEDYTHCELHCKIQPQDTLVFIREFEDTEATINTTGLLQADMNKNVTVQMKMEIQPEDGESFIEYSDIYKIEMINSINTQIANGGK